jgi:hypothetical protein
VSKKEIVKQFEIEDSILENNSKAYYQYFTIGLIED